MCQEVTAFCAVVVLAGAKLFAGVEELKELLEAALRDGPGTDGYQPPAHLRLSSDDSSPGARGLGNKAML